MRRDLHVSVRLHTWFIYNQQVRSFAKFTDLADWLLGSSKQHQHQLPADHADAMLRMIAY